MARQPSDTADAEIGVAIAAGDYYQALDRLITHHNAVHNRQAESGSLTHWFGGEERLKQACHRIWCHAMARVLYREAAIQPLSGARC